MGSKKSGGGKTVGPPKTIPNKDHYARVSYLYQASSYLLTKPKYSSLSKAFSKNVDTVSKKTVLKLSPNLKRTICKKCKILLIAGLTQTSEIQNKSKDGNSKSDILVHTCINCQSAKRFPVGINRDYRLFQEKEGISHDVE